MARPLWEQLDELDEYRQLGRLRTDHVVPVREPMVLVSQIQRSGGTLLSRLFDGHPACHAHPYELKIGHKARWPKLELDAPESWFAALYEHMDDGCMGTISEVFDAEGLYRPRGCMAQAWSVAELLRITALINGKSDTAAAPRHQTKPAADSRSSP